jgi:hypothetical protein
VCVCVCVCCRGVDRGLAEVLQGCYRGAFMLFRARISRQEGQYVCVIRPVTAKCRWCKGSGKGSGKGSEYLERREM